MVCTEAQTVGYTMQVPCQSAKDAWDSHLCPSLVKVGMILTSSLMEVSCEEVKAAETAMRHLSECYAKSHTAEVRSFKGFMKHLT